MKSMGALLLLSVFFSATGSAQVKIDSPIRGWRYSTDKTDTVQEVNYPASSVNMAGNTSKASFIRGRINSSVKTKDPLSLVVNGLEMPLRPDGETFARPFIFGTGSNSVQVRAGQERHAVQFYEANSSTTPARLRVLLSWNTDGTDLDLHLVTPDGEHIFYGSRLAPSGAALDVDVTTGFGPEIISAPSPRNGTYLVYVNYYGGRGDGNEDGDKLTTAKLSIVTRAGTTDEKIETALVPLRAPGEITLVRSFQYP